jgi:uncharacterized protein (TIGR02246 family)
MGVAAPEQMASVFERLFNARDTAGLLELYARDAVFTFDGESKAVGLQQIEGALAGFLSAPLKFKGHYVNVHVSGDTALARMKYELIDEAAGTTTAGVSTEVMRRGPDGLWRFIIDDAGGGSRPA